MNIYDIFQDLKSRSDMCRERKRCIVVFLNNSERSYFFDFFSSKYDIPGYYYRFDLIFIAYTKSGKIIDVLQSYSKNNYKNVGKIDKEMFINEIR